MAGWRILLAIASASGCGRLAFDELESRTDAHSVSCGPFGAPTPVPELASTADDWDPFVIENEVYWASSRMTALRLWVGERASSAEPFVPRQLTELGATAGDNSPAVRRDGLLLVFSRDSPDPNLWFSSRASVALPFDSPQPLTELNSAFREVAGSISADGLRLYFESTAGPGGHDLYVARRTSETSSFMPREPLAELNDPNFAEDFPFVSDDELTILFSSNRPGMGGYDVYVATRASITMPFDPPRLLDGVNSVLDDGGASLTPDGQTLYLNYSAVFDGSGPTSEISRAQRSCE